MRPLHNDGGLRLKVSNEILDAIEIVLSAFKSHRNSDGYTYLSMPITSGKLFYDVLEKHDSLTLDELMAKDKDILYNEVILPNIEINTAVADKIADNTKKTVIAPAVFEAKKQRWSEAAYMFLWYRVLEEIIDETIMVNHWQYSNGGVQEFVRSHEIKFNFVLSPRFVESHLPSYLPRSYWPVFKGILKGEGKAIQYLDTMNVKDEKLDDISLNHGADLVANAILDLEKKGFNPEKLKESLFEMGGLAECHEWYKGGWMGDYVDMPWEIDHKKIYDSIRRVWPSFMSCLEKEAARKDTWRNSNDILDANYFYFRD